MAVLGFMLLLDGQYRLAGSEAGCVVEKGSGRASLAPTRYAALLVAKWSGNLCSKEGGGVRRRLKGQNWALGDLGLWVKPTGDAPNGAGDVGSEEKTLRLFKSFNRNLKE